MRRFCERAERSVKMIRSSICTSRVRRMTFACTLVAAVFGVPQTSRSDYGFIAIDNFVGTYLGGGVWEVEGQVDGTISTAGLPVFIGGVVNDVVYTDQDGYFSYTFTLNPRMQWVVVTASVLELDGVDFYTVETLLMH